MSGSSRIVNRLSEAAVVPWDAVLDESLVRVLARCNGFDVEAGGEVVGSVATPVFSGTRLRPDYLLVRVGDHVAGRFRTVTPELIVAADSAEQVVVLGIDADGVAALPEPDLLLPD